VKEPHRRQVISQCIHTKNIYSLIDLDKQDNMFHFLSNHEKKCDSCSGALMKYKADNFAAKVFVPKIFLPKDLKETFNREVSELFKTAGFNDVENKKIKMKNALSFFDQLGENFIKILYSKNMLVAYVFAFAIFISLKYVL
jgi:hypothetical protein